MARLARMMPRSREFPRLIPREAEERTPPPAFTFLDRLISYFSPTAGLRRMRSRAAAEVVARHYEAAASGRRTAGWNRSQGDSNSVVLPALARVRAAARDLVRNNGDAEAAVTTIEDHVIGCYGLTAKPKKTTGVTTAQATKAKEAWDAWAGTTACDVDGRKDFAGIQRLVMRTVVESGECLIRKRTRRPEDGLPIPLQLEVLDPDYLDTSKTVLKLQNGGRIVAGVEKNVLGQTVAYWLFPEHPGGAVAPAASRRIPAESVIHVFRQDRPQQVRGISWFAPVLLKFKDEDEFEDATLMKQKVAACLAVLTSDANGESSPVGEAKDGTDSTGEVAGLLDSLEPGMIGNLPAGRNITVVDPPTVREFTDFTRTTKRSIASGLGVSYEDFTGDYSAVNYSSARMSRLRHYARVEVWRWGMLVPQVCDPVWRWAMEALGIMGLEAPPMQARWSAPPIPMLEPDKEGMAYSRLIRNGLMSLAEAHRERGYDPDEVFEELAEVNKVLDKLGLKLDCDPRNTTQAGMMQLSTEPPPPRDPNAPASGGADGAAGDGSGADGGDDEGADGATASDGSAAGAEDDAADAEDEADRRARQARRGNRRSRGRRR